MKQIEKIAFDKLTDHLYDIADRIRKDKVEEMSFESLRQNIFFVQSDLQKAFDTIRAIEEANPELYKR